ncbi:MAG: hypothetical protein IPH76_17475 [Xanthomonadales bacterium]|nr:hypothetical protein [Xanthomonadales bacterium]
MYALEFAQQGDWRNGADIIDADYYLTELRRRAAPTPASLAANSFGGDGHYGFQTPFATLHAFNGWAEVPDHAGERSGRHLCRVQRSDRQAAVGRFYHQYEADHGHADYGSRGTPRSATRS